MCDCTNVRDCSYEKVGLDTILNKEYMGGVNFYDGIQSVDVIELDTCRKKRTRYLLCGRCRHAIRIRQISIHLSIDELLDARLLAIRLIV